MTAAPSSLAERLIELRHSFDRSFADPPRTKSVTLSDLLAIRLGGQPFALRLSEITGLFVGKKITRVPGGSGALLGIAGFRGAIVPVYDLQALLGHSSTETPRWLVMAATGPVAFAFEAFEGQLRVPADAILPQQSRPETRNCVRDLVQTDNLVRPIIHLASVVDGITS